MPSNPPQTSQLHNPRASYWRHGSSMTLVTSANGGAGCDSYLDVAYAHQERPVRGIHGINVQGAHDLRGLQIRDVHHRENREVVGFVLRNRQRSALHS
eukprot:scaffold452_cov491-Prasinococcus_capsulatus_cf.AAC.5